MEALGCPIAAIARSLLAVLLVATAAWGQVPELKETKARAEQGDAEAQYNLAVMYDMGIGAPKNYTESGKWYAKAAAQGVAEAQFQLGVRYYEHGKQAKDNYVKAFSWFYKAALQGMPEAQYNAGLMYQLGRGVPTNRVEAYKWYIISAAQGYTKALAARENLASDLLRKDIAEGERRAAAFEPKRTFQPQANLAAANGDPPKGSGTGFFITEDGYLVTNYHVVRGAKSCMVKTRQGKFPARVVKTDEKNDLALLKVIGNFPALPVGNSKEAKLGDAVFTIGFPNTDVQGIEPKLTRGDINSIAGIKDDPRHFQISVPVQPGNSGGPLVDSAGNVIGVVTMRLGDWRTLKLTGALPQNVNYAVKSSHIRELVDAVPEAAKKLKASTATRKFEEIVKHVEDAVGIVLSY
jgi:S1-C subfamily serine protease